MHPKGDEWKTNTTVIHFSSPTQAFKRAPEAMNTVNWQQHISFEHTRFYEVHYWKCRTYLKACKLLRRHLTPILNKQH